MQHAFLTPVKEIRHFLKIEPDQSMTFYGSAIHTFSALSFVDTGAPEFPRCFFANGAEPSRTHIREVPEHVSYLS
jgi:hypothetical protein